MRLRTLALILFVCLLGFAPEIRAAGRYAVAKETVEGHTTYHLRDSQLHMDFGVVPDIGNFAYQFKVNGKDVLIAPDSLQAYLDRHWFCCGIPFLAPWANRIDHDYFYFQNKKYLLNDSLGNLLRVPPFGLPIHGLVVFDSRWLVVKSGASDAEGAFVTSRLEFFRYPDLMENFPFALVYEMTYRLQDGKLANTTQVTNVSKSPLPVHFGYHPYFKPDGPREDWQVSINAEAHWIPDNSERLIPTGVAEPAEKFHAGVRNFKLGKTFIDDGFSGLIRDAEGLAHYTVKGKTETVEVIFGKEFDFGHVYAPLDNTLICFEPETGPTNAFNLNHEGKFPGLIVLEPGKVFAATFWIVPKGF